MKHSGELILYKNFENGELFYNFTWILENYDSEFYNRSDIVELYYRCLNQLIELAVSHGFEGNLWHCFLAFIMVKNAYSTACEMKGAVNGSINAIAAHDFAILKEMFDYNLNEVAKTLEIDDMDVLQNFKGPDDNGSVFNKRIRDRICEMSKTLAAAATTEEFMDDMVSFYKDFGVGKLGLHKAFRIGHDENGKVELANTGDKYKEFLKFMHKLYAEGLMEQEAFTITGEEVTTKEQEDVYGSLGCGSAPFVMAGKDISYDANWLGLSGLTSDVHSERETSIASPVQNGIMVAVNANTQYPEAMARFLDYFYTDEGMLSATKVPS